ncbi:hypothetical protein HOI83_00820 [Candidatus Uhrbacteria bacterium]|jgi:hypothetical protein|nr:hypothetical protein [Candidatus Uhrbacteria bacterium]
MNFVVNTEAEVKSIMEQMLDIGVVSKDHFDEVAAADPDAAKRRENLKRLDSWRECVDRAKAWMAQNMQYRGVACYASKEAMTFVLCEEFLAGWGRMSSDMTLQGWCSLQTQVEMRDLWRSLHETV